MRAPAQRRVRSRGRHALAALALCVVPGAEAAAAQPSAQPQISIIIDDMGNQRDAGLEAVALPGPVAYAFLPHTPHAAELAELAHLSGKEVILHIPMQSHSGRRLGPGGLTDGMDRIALMRVVSADLRSVPHVSGVSNHMGSLLTPRREAMGWLMDLLRVRGNLFFVDSRTTRHSAALEAAQHNRVPSTWRDVFLDHDLEEAEILRAFEGLVRLARRRGSALAIGHPHEETLSVLARVIPRLDEYGVRLVPVAALIRARESARPPFPSTAQFRAANEAELASGHRLMNFPAVLGQSFSPGHAASTR